MSLRLVKSGEPEPDTVLRDRWDELKAKGDALLASGELDGFFVLLDAGEATQAGVHGPDPLSLLWAVKRSAEEGMDEAVFG